MSGSPTSGAGPAPVPRSPGGAGAWAVETVDGVATLHGRALPERFGRTVWVGVVDRPTLVLGSTQRADVVDPAGPAGPGGPVAVVRRRSGGGAVLLEPGRAVWIDVLVPATDALWHDDVGRAMHWVGDTWARALADVGRDGAEVHRGGLVATRWSALVCFAGLGAGEVTLAGRKAVGVSQRRTRAGARLQCVVPIGADPAGVVPMLALSPAERDDLTGALRSSVADVEVVPDELTAAFLRSLP